MEKLEFEQKIVAQPGGRRQFIAAIIANLSTLAYGFVIGYASPSMALLQSPKSPLENGPLTDNQISWLNGIQVIGGIITLPFCTSLSEKFGRKITSCLISIPLGICWLSTIFTTTFVGILVARFLSGVAGAISLFIVSIYVTEISNDNIRGFLGSFLVFFINIGILLGYIVGATLSYQLSAIFGLAIPVIFIVFFVFMPETPVFFVRNNRIPEAIRSLMWLKNNDKQTVDKELLRLEEFEKANSNDDNNRSVSVKSLFKDRGTIKGLIISLVLLNGQQLCGISIVVVYTSKIFEIAQSSLSPNASAIIVGVIQVIGSVLSTLLVERAGRRLLLLISCGGMAIAHICLGIFLYMQLNLFDVTPFKWIPITALSLFTLIYCLGMGPLPFVVSSEIFSSDICALANSVAQMCMWILAFFLLKFFPNLIEIFGMYGCFLLFACFCMALFIFTYFFIPETKGKSIKMILDELNGLPKESEQNGYIKALDVKKNSHSFIP
ncbi:hypothetical protein PV325_013378 [Microctonus aethiopoides]|uniref:Major facilitator superfamily (MFS) profile domain-containing protein n=1 Tax=Microctonus aethiopoides TaxID=144406 RepID=A0AA39KRD6_9HYME|nr:hypothetical protein PV325_013378 [Microctonus aethiopoides]KAK0093646.1 hypothetical protein PV326_013018 [Microctonus aethiopoides]KAK0170949.1 hypothetical protein PV328_008725 [Microctonus aethiopoides]